MCWKSKGPDYIPLLVCSHTFNIVVVVVAVVVVVVVVVAVVVVVLQTSDIDEARKFFFQRFITNWNGIMTSQKSEQKYEGFSLTSIKRKRCRYRPLPPSFESTDFYDFIIWPHWQENSLYIFIVLCTDIYEYFWLFIHFPVIEIDRPLHCHGKVIVFVSHLFSTTLTLWLWD
jgi:hypothetical protein